MKRYDKYKDSGIDWIGEIPEHWESKRLKYIGYLYGGLAGKSSNDFNQESNLNNKPFIPFTNICNNKVIDPTQMQQVVIEEGEKQNQVKKGDLFFMMSSENFDDVGKSSILLDDLGETYLNSFCKGFRFTNERYYPPFINYLLLSKPYRSLVLTEANGYTRINLKIDKINDIPLKVPPTLNEQKAIADYLDRKTAEIDELIKQKEQLLQLYEEEKTAIINQAVTKGINPNAKMKDSGIDWLGEIPEHWEVKRFDFIFVFSRGLSITKDDLKSDGIPCISYGEIHSKCRFEVKPEINNLKYVDDGYIELSPKSLMCKNDFVFADTSEDIEGSGNFSYVNSDTPLFAGYHTIVARLNKKNNFNARYLAYVFESLPFRNQIRCKVTGTKVYSITQQILKYTNIAYPSLDEQNKITVFIDNELSRIDLKIKKNKALIELLKEYKNSIITEVATGKVKVY